ncbi:MAG: hypothetical protein ACOC4M_07375 [Promethearchaeia archaeon]
MSASCPDCGRPLTPVVRTYLDPPRINYICFYCNEEFRQKQKTQKKGQQPITRWIKI